MSWAKVYFITSQRTNYLTNLPRVTYVSNSQETLLLYWFRLSRPASMYMMSSGLVGRGLRLQIPDISPASVAGNLLHFRSNSWSSHLWRCLPQIQAKRQEFVTWDHDPRVRKTILYYYYYYYYYYYVLISNFILHTSFIVYNWTVGIFVERLLNS